MRRVAAMVVIVCSIAAFGQSAGEPGARQSILALEHAWDQALERSDVKALSAIFDSGLIYIDYDGTLLTKAAYLLRVKANDTHLEQIVTEEMDVQVFGSTALVVGTYRARGMDKGKAYMRRGRFMDTWVLAGKNWICIAASTTPILH